LVAGGEDDVVVVVDMADTANDTGSNLWLVDESREVGKDGNDTRMKNDAAMTCALIVTLVIFYNV